MEAFWDQLREWLGTLNGICRLLGMMAAIITIFMMILIWIEPVEIAKLNVNVRDPPAWRLASAAGLYALLSGCLFYLGYRNVAFGRSIAKQPDGSYVVDIGAKTKIRILFGDIADWHAKLGTALVVLPANEHFDEECFTDGNSSLAAFASKHFDSGAMGLDAAVRPMLEKLTGTTRQAGLKTFMCYGVGTTIELKGKTSGICLVGVSSKVPTGVVSATAAGVACSIAKCYEYATTNNMRTILFPVLGSGKGGMSEHLALGLMVIVLGALIKQQTGFAPSEIRIVKFTPQDATATEKKREMRKTLETVSNACKFIQS